MIEDAVPANAESHAKAPPGSDMGADAGAGTSAPAPQAGSEPAPRPLADGRAPQPEATPPVGDGQEARPDFPDDWRERAADGDEDIARLLKRFGSVKAVARALKETRAQVSKGLAALPEDAGEDEKAAWRQARGIPQTPDAYEVAPPEGMTWSEEDQAALDAFTRFAHARNWSQEQVADAARWYVDDQIARAQQQAVALHGFARETEKTLKAEYGRDFERTVNLVARFGRDEVGAEAWESLVNARMADGTYLGDQPGFIRLLAGSALERGDGAPYEAGTITGGVSDAEMKKAHAELVGRAGAGDRAARAKLADPDYERRIGAVYDREAKAAGRAAKAG